MAVGATAAMAASFVVIASPAHADPDGGLTISPGFASIFIGDSQTYTAEGFDNQGSVGDVTNDTTFTLTDNSSNTTACTSNSCQPPHTGLFTVTGTWTDGDGDIHTDTASLRAKPRVLDHIMITPQTSSITTDDTQSYHAEGYDNSGYDLGNVTADTTFTITGAHSSCTGHVCSSTTPGSFTVTGTDGSFTDTASLTVNNGALDHIVISPSSASVDAGEQQQYSAEAFDAHDNSLGDVSNDTTFSIAGGICTGRLCKSTVPGAHTVTGTDGAFSDTATLNVGAGPLDSIVISPSTASVSAGDSQAYTAEGYDEYGNDLGDVTDDTDFSIDAPGSCSGASCSATMPDDYTVTGTDGSATDTATLNVTAGPLDHIVMTPSSSARQAGVSQTYSVEGFDQYNNDLGDVTATTALTIAPDGSCDATSCTATAVGSHAVTATNSSATDTSTLQVNPAALDHLVVTPASATITANQAKRFIAHGADQYGNDLGDVTMDATFTISGANSSCTDNSCTSTVAGSHTVTATYNGKSGTATLMVNPTGLKRITITPQSSSIVAGQSQSYVIKAYDRYNNLLGDVSSSAHLSIAGGGSCTGSTCTSSVAGSHFVTAGYMSVHVRATLSVTPAALYRIGITPSDSQIAPGGSQAYTVTAYDQYGNSRGDVTSSSSFSITPNGTCTGSTCSATARGRHKVTATYQSKTASAVLRVVPPSSSGGRLPAPTSVRIG